MALAVLCGAVAHAEYIPSAGLLEPDDTISEGSISPDSTTHPSYYALMKDGSGTVTITENVNLNQAIYVREGELLVGKQNNQVRINLSPSDNPNDEWDNPSRPYLPNLVVAGKNTGDSYATITFDNAVLTSNQEATVIIGSADGNGAMVIDNKSQIGLGNHQTTMIGERIGLSSGCPTADAEGNKYVGSYSEAANGSETLFGRGVVTVKGASTYNTGYQQFYMSEGELNAIGEGTQVNIGGNYGTQSILGYDADSTSDINVKDGAKINVRTKYLFTGSAASDNSSVNINVDGPGSSFTVDEKTPAHPEVPNSSQNTWAILGYYSGAAAGATVENHTTSVNVTNGGTVSFLSGDYTFLGYGAQSEGSSVAVNVDEESFFNSKLTYMYDGATIDNKGTASIEYLYMLGGDVINEGTLTDWSGEDDVLYMTDGYVQNSGTIDLNIILANGEIEALSGSVFDEVHLQGGSFTLVGDVTFNSFFAGYQAGEIVFNDGSTLDMQGNSFTLNGSSLVLLVDFEVTDETDISLNSFLINVGSTDLTHDTSIVIRGANGTEVVRTLSSMSIPEPTTATLSLLALAGLAARRRRK